MAVRAAVAVIVALAALIACAAPLDELTPFPCAADRTCPAGLACIANATCVAPRFDAPCQEGRTDCRRAGPTGTCSLGVCGEQCSEKEPCQVGRVCTVEPGRGTGACVLDCTSGGECPEGLVCRELGYGGQRGCVAPGNVTALGSPCTGDEECANAGAAARCQSGVCALPCNRSEQCAAGTVCSTPDSSVEGTCLRDCSVDRTCSVGTTCLPLWRDGKFACFGADNRVRACKSVEVSFTCSRACGTSLVSGRVACDGGTFCPAGARCEGEACVCEGNSRAVTCSGESCNGANCEDGSSWWCAPGGEGGVGCDDDISRFAVTCSCWDGTTRTAACGSRATCEALCADECSVIKQDCSPGPRPKCSEVTTADGRARRTCVEQTGGRANGEICRRTPGGPVGGADDCAPGLFCSLASAGPIEYRCRAYCDSNTPCPSGEVCVPGARFGHQSDTSVCRPGCDVFASSSECPTGLSCKIAFSDTRGYCSAAGSAAAGEACLSSAECAGSMFCVAGGYCAEPCDEAHPCAGGTRCDAKPGRIGVCLTL